MEQVQTLTVLETTAAHLDIKNDVLKNYIGLKKRYVEQDCNNNSESLGNSIVENDPLLEEPQDTSYFGLFTFKAKIKWRNTIAISLLHLTAAVCSLIFISNRIFSATTIWGKLKLFKKLMKEYATFLHCEIHFSLQCMHNTIKNLVDSRCI